MSISASGQQAAPPHRRVKYTEQPFPSPNATQTARSSPSVSPATSSNLSTILPTKTLPRQLPVPFENSHVTGGRPLRPNFYEQVSPGPVHPHTCDSLDCAMVKVMTTVEVLEQICTYIPSYQVLSLRLVSKKWRSLISGSPQLSIHLFLEPRWSYPATEFLLLRLVLPGLEIKRGDPIHLGQWVEVQMNLDAAKEITATVQRTHGAGNGLFRRRFRDLRYRRPGFPLGRRHRRCNSIIPSSSSRNLL
jgi:hypothetical protein